MPGLRAACAAILVTWLVEGACAQQPIPGASAAAPAPSPDSEEAGAPDAGREDDPRQSADWRERVRAARQRHGDWLACVTAKGRQCSRAPAPDPMELLLNDDTLVKGDIVSTPQGLKVFRGRSSAPHRPADFE